MRSYLNIVKEVLYYGQEKTPVRFDSHAEKGDKPFSAVENETIGLPFITFRHDMQRGFPLLTTKQVNFKSVCIELEGFIKGITSKKWFREKGTKIWNDWCPPSCIPEFVKKDKQQLKDFMREVDDLGPIYGSQWRDFAASGYDQLAAICNRLRENPYDRRMVCSAWAPHLINDMALPPCHYAWQVVVYGDRLNLTWKQRSCDLMLGVPFNIASYGLLLCLLARHAGLQPGILQGNLDDCHIYKNHTRAAEEQLQRAPRNLPTLLLPRTTGRVGFDIFEWTSDMAMLSDYNPHGRIEFGEVTVV